MNGEAIRVLIVEDQAMVRGALVALLQLEPDIEVVGDAQDAASALQQVAELRPDIVLSDIEMPDVSGIELTAQITQSHPGCRVVLLTTFARSGYLRRALEAGARGYLLKDAPAEKLAESIRRVHAGKREVSSRMLLDAWQERDPLTARERQVLRLAREGKTTATIAQHLSLSEGTVRNYLSEAISKLGAANRIDAARIAHQNGWL